MVPRRLRLSRRTFPASRGHSIVGEHLSLVYGASPAGGCAVVVSKKTAGRSVDRHTIKRRILEVLRPHCSTSRYIVVYAKKGCATLSFTELSQELTILIKTMRTH